MLETIVRQETSLYLIGALLGISAWTKMVSIFTTRKMVRAAGKIHNSNHRLMKLIKSKFEHANLVSDRVQNVEAFVNKFVYEYTVFGIRLHTWQVIPKRMFWCILLVGVFVCFESYKLIGMGKVTIQTIQWTSLCLVVNFLLAFLFDESTSINASKNYIVEYLSNVCAHRYAKKLEEIEEPEEELPEEPVAEAIEEELCLVQELEEEAYKKSEQEKRIRAILEEFLA